MSSSIQYVYQSTAGIHKCDVKVKEVNFILQILTRTLCYKTHRTNMLTLITVCNKTYASPTVHVYSKNEIDLIRKIFHSGM